eukprot:CAMPEP_0202863496 /NCGR_PEP_ID=MMETSP1391-20130828/4111_1 /ASSEMBLY_ACC=CAM_ASM_000867 /TAXON_ID=1034604 /ORGANISM="Chlamydomonas leiostraca, Strain SAG 11-49" /LENGTH=400 /DNA_ID=CAMNT_0049543141 /DNA_START=12 /DNA_END=1215 /DNA_ORIENTATION=-
MAPSSTALLGAGGAVAAAAVCFTQRKALTRVVRNIMVKAQPADVPLPPPKQVKIALCQLTVTADKNKNIATATEAIKRAAANGAQLVVLPEMWNCPYSNDSFPTYAEDIDGGNAPSVKALSEAARDARVTLVGGSLPERVGPKLYNTCCVFDSSGKLLAKHRKVHLFDIDIPGKIAFRESDTLTPGDGPTVVDTEAGRLGLGICYDIRFPELAQIYAARGCQLLVYPGAFNTTTGPLHWELLQRARAIDNLVYVATCSPARNPGSSYQAWGHSTVIGPFAEVLATCDHEETTVYATLDYAQVAERRSQIPVRSQKRWDLYGLVDKAGDAGTHTAGRAPLYSVMTPVQPRPAMHSLQAQQQRCWRWGLELEVLGGGDGHGARVRHGSAGQAGAGSGTCVGT